MFRRQLLLDFIRGLLGGSFRRNIAQDIADVHLIDEHSRTGA